MTEPDLDALLTRAQRGEHDAVCTELSDLLARSDVPETERMFLHGALGAARYYAGDYRQSIAACDQACLLAGRLRETGWHAYALSMRASSWIEVGQTQRAADDLLESELLLHATLARNPMHDRVRRSLAGSYAELEMFERALGHFTADAGDPATQVVDAINLSNLHLRWARQLQRDAPDDEPTPRRREHLLAAAAGLRRAAELLADGPKTWAPLVAKMRAETAAQLDPRSGIGPLRDLIDQGVDTQLANTTAVSLATLVTALRRDGRLDESDQRGRAALTLISDPRTYAETITDVLFAVHRTQRSRSVPGVHAVDAYLATAATELRLLRQERLDAFEQHLDHQLGDRELSELSDRVRRDPLTRIGNRRALESWFAEHPRGPAVLALIDLDNFKAINDAYGHAVGDRVLVQFAEALAEALPDALPVPATLVRYGGDEFVVAMATADADQVRKLADLIRGAATGLRLGDISSQLRLSASVGTQTASAGSPTRGLLDQADRSMYADKEPEVAPQYRSDPPVR